MTEGELVELAQSGDTAAFEQLYRTHSGRIHALCWRLCGGDGALAEDLLQEAFVRAWNKLHLFHGKSRFGTWLHRLAANLVQSAGGDPKAALTTIESELAKQPKVEGSGAGQIHLAPETARAFEAGVFR